MNRLSRTTIGVVLGVVAATAPSTATAETIICCGGYAKWASPSVTFKWLPDSFPVGNPNIGRIQAAAARWTELAESNVSITVTADNDNTDHSNENEIWIVPGAEPEEGLYIAETLQRWSKATCDCPTATLEEADIVRYSVANGDLIAWNSSEPSGSTNLPFVNSTIYFGVTILHEMGHGIGIEHTLNGLVRMSPVYPSGGWAFSGSNRVATLHWDRKDVNLLYPAAASYSDLYMANVQDGTDSVNGVGVSTPLSDNPSTGADNFYPRNPATDTNSGIAGTSTIQARYCMSNLGPSNSPTTTINRYLSTDRVWHSTDIVLPSFTEPPILGYNGGCQTQSFVIPAGTPAGAYYILYGNGTSGNNIAVQNRTFTVL
jgi:hypothetical protein